MRASGHWIDSPPFWYAFNAVSYQQSAVSDQGETSDQTLAVSFHITPPWLPISEDERWVAAES